MNRPHLLSVALIHAGIVLGTSHAHDVRFQWMGDHESDFFGDVVEVVGDVDDDGIRDVAIGSPFANYQAPPPFSFFYENVGVVEIRSGRNGNLLHRWLGNLAGGEEFGASLCDAGDVNEDGHTDVLVGAPRATGPALHGGKVELRSGLDGSVLEVFHGFQTDARFGHAMAAGDMDGDGLFEVAVGSPHFDIDDSHGGPFQEGNLHVYRCVDGSLLMSRAGEFFVEDFRSYYPREWGLSVCYVGDQDGDGLGAIAVGAPLSTIRILTFDSWENAGFVDCFEPAGFSREVLFGTTDGELVGAVVESLGDLDDDGELDLVVGAPGISDAGSLLLYDGENRRLTISGSSSKPIGWKVAVAEDATGDGLADLLIGSPLADVGRLVNITNAGVVELRHATDGTLVRRYEGVSENDRLGDAIAAGPLDLQGLDELVVGVPQDDQAGSNAGSVLVYAGEDCVESASWEVYGEGLAGTLGVPGLSGFGEPALGRTFQLVLTSSSSEPALTFLALGFAPLDEPLKGGTLLVDPFLFARITLDSPGMFVPINIPYGLGVCGVEVYFQALIKDAGAERGIAFTPGLKMVIGD